MKKKIAVLDWIDKKLRRVCCGLSQDARVITVVSFCIIFGGLSIYMTISSIYNIGKRDASVEYMEMERFKQLEKQHSLQHSNDSINLLIIK